MDNSSKISASDADERHCWNSDGFVSTKDDAVELLLLLEAAAESLFVLNELLMVKVPKDASKKAPAVS